MKEDVHANIADQIRISDDVTSDEVVIDDEENLVADSVTASDGDQLMSHCNPVDEATDAPRTITPEESGESHGCPIESSTAVAGENRNGF